MGQDVVRLMEHLKIPRAHIVAYSAGCSISVQLLTVNPERFVTASLIAGSGRRLPSWTPADIEVDEAQARELERSPQLNNDSAAVAAMVRSRRNWVITAAQVDAIQVPLLAIVGGADPNLAGVKQFKQQKPSLDVLVVEGATHAGDAGILRRAELVKKLQQFFREHATRQSGFRGEVSTRSLTRVAPVGGWCDPEAAAGERWPLADTGKRPEEASRKERP
jgi:hypothetical protein